MGFLQPEDAIRSGVDLALEPLDATFKDNHRAPLHSWFPYLEGYSPRFVERVQAEFLPNARRIIEPFAGSGTTPIVLAQAGIDCAYSEVNPAMAFVVETKLAVLRLSAADRHRLAERLAKLARELASRTSETEPDTTLRDSYVGTFGGSVFFDETAMDEVLRLRVVADELGSEDSTLAAAFTLCVLSVLIPTSRLERAGDLRFKTPKELALGLPSPTQAVVAGLQSQARDLGAVQSVIGSAWKAASEAAELSAELEADEWDGVITSPPYLNGTNYIRNARLELWFLRAVSSKTNLRELRDRVVTSGINDVDARTTWRPVTQGVERVVQNLTERAYDQRIAKMAGGYFHDMDAVLRSLAYCVRPGGHICVDIGDSVYAGVHVPTDDLLVEVAEAAGLETTERIHLRKRTSKGGQAVRQQLLVFRKPATTDRSKTHIDGSPFARAGLLHPPASQASAWKLFKETLPHQKAPYSKREWGGPAHSMCSYQGKMKPALAHHLIAAFTKPGDVVVDPFSGAGTIPYEACRMSREGHGIDISRLGHVLSLAKVAATSSRRIVALLVELDEFIKRYELSSEKRTAAAAVRFNGSIEEYFHADTLREVIAARDFFLSRWNESAEWALLYACTLHLLHGNRPYALSRRSHPVTPFKPTGEFEYRALLPRLRDKLARVNDDLTAADRGHGVSAQADCTLPWPQEIPIANAIITSPPFFDSTRFYMANWMRYWFVGWERADFDSLPRDFVETRQKVDLDVYKAIYAAARERLADDGVFVLHLGQSPKCDMGEELAKRVSPWFAVDDVFTEGVEHCESHGIRDKGTVSGHTYLVLKPR